MKSEQLKLAADVRDAKMVLSKARSVIEHAEAAVDFCKLTERLYLKKLMAAKTALRNHRKAAPLLLK
jgi:hypothetical protein